MDKHDEPSVMDLAPRWLGDLLLLGWVMIAVAGVVVAALIVHAFSLPALLAGVLYVVGGAAFAAAFAILYLLIVEFTLGAKYRRANGFE